MVREIRNYQFIPIIINILEKAQSYEAETFSSLFFVLSLVVSSPSASIIMVLL